jgi:autophagy-related protein 18
LQLELSQGLKYFRQILFNYFTSQVTFYLLIVLECGPISIVEMLYTTNLILLVGLAEFGDFSPRKVTIWSTSQNIVLCSSWPFLSKINIAKINKKRMIIGERNFLHIYTTGDMKIMNTIDVGTVTLGKLVLSANSDKNNFVCFSSSNDEGMVKVYDLLYLSFKTSIKAHKSPILKMTLNYKGDMLATCSCKGTIIRVFSLPKGEKIVTYKRGISSAYIFCLNFSFENDKLITTSDTGTMHVFDLKPEGEEYILYF